MKYKYVIM